MVAPDVALLLMVRVPVAAPVAVGSNSTFSVAVWPGVRVTGREVPVRLKPVPVSLAALIVTDAVPDEVSTSDCVAGVFSATLPNARLLLLTFSAAEATPSCSA